MGQSEEVDLTDIIPKLAARQLEGWAPQPGPQLAALMCPAYEVLYGGAAGGGKTDYTLADHLRDALLYQFYKGVIFRRSYPELDEVIQRARWFFPTACPDVSERDGGKEWKFPLGGRVLLRHLQDYKAALSHKSAEYTKITFEELTTFEERQYLYLHTRARSSKGVPVSIHSTTNPGGTGHAFVFKRWGPWLDPHYQGPHAEPGEILWFISGPKGEDIWVPAGTPNALSRTFIPAKLSDNKMLTKADASYELRLNAQDPLTREQLKNGNWLAKPSPKTFFNREWAPMVDSVPPDVRVVRGWDRASTEEGAGKDPDWTAGVKVGYSEASDLYYIMDVERFRRAPGGVKRGVKEAATGDGVNCWQIIPVDPGSAGVFEASDWLTTLLGFVVDVSRETGDKVTRARVWSGRFAPEPGQVYGKFRIVRGPWNEAYLSEIEDFPTPNVHDDQVDATSSAFRALVNGSGGAGLSGADLNRAGISQQTEDDDDEREDKNQRRGTGGGGYRW